MLARKWLHANASRHLTVAKRLLNEICLDVRLEFLFSIVLSVADEWRSFEIITICHISYN